MATARVDSKRVHFVICTVVDKVRRMEINEELYNALKLVFSVIKNDAENQATMNKWVNTIDHDAINNAVGDLPVQISGFGNEK